MRHLFTLPVRPAAPRAIALIDRPARQLRFGAFALDLPRCTLLRDERAVPLRRQSFDTLRYLVERSGQVVSRAEIVAAVCGSSPADPDASVFQCIKEIRKALGEDSRWMIRTIPGTGYEFKATVNMLYATEEEASAPLGEQDADVESPVTASATGLAGLMRRPRLMGAVALAAFIALAILDALIWPSVAAFFRPRDALMESFLYLPAGLLPGGAERTIQTKDGKIMTCIGGEGKLIPRQCRWN